MRSRDCARSALAKATVVAVLPIIASAAMVSTLPFIGRAAGDAPDKNVVFVEAVPAIGKTSRRSTFRRSSLWAAWKESLCRTR
jgi:hypothetical protein